MRFILIILRGCVTYDVYSEVKSFIKKETLAQVFSYEFCEISKNTFFTEHLRATASVYLHYSSDTESISLY